jgi:hypothetical protein
LWRRTRLSLASRVASYALFEIMCCSWRMFSPPATISQTTRDDQDASSVGGLDWLERRGSAVRLCGCLFAHRARVLYRHLGGGSAVDDAERSARLVERTGQVLGRADRHTTEVVTITSLPQLADLVMDGTKHIEALAQQALCCVEEAAREWAR